MANNKLGEMLGLLAIILVAVAFVPGTNVPVLSNLFGTAGQVGDDGVPVTNVVVTQADKACGSTTMTIHGVKKYAESTSVTAENATVYINGNRKGTFSQGGTFTAQGGDLLNVYYNLDKAGATYYASHQSGNIPCTGQTAAFITSNILGNGGMAGPLQDPAYKFYQQDAGPSTTIINEDNTLNVLGTPQSVTAGQTRTVEVNLFPTFEDGYGVAGGSTLACQFTDSEWDQARSVVAMNGQVLGSAKYVPTTTVFPLEAVNRTTQMWHVPGIDGKATSKIEFTIRAKGDDTNEPTETSDWNCTLFDTDLYETDDGTVLVDIENRDDNTNIGLNPDFEFFIDFN